MMMTPDRIEARLLDPGCGLLRPHQAVAKIAAKFLRGRITLRRELAHCAREHMIPGAATLVALDREIGGVLASGDIARKIDARKMRSEPPPPPEENKSDRIRRIAAATLARNLRSSGVHDRLRAALRQAGGLYSGETDWLVEVVTGRTAGSVAYTQVEKGEQYSSRCKYSKNDAVHRLALSLRDVRPTIAWLSGHLDDHETAIVTPEGARYRVASGRGKTVRLEKISAKNA